MVYEHDPDSFGQTGWVNRVGSTRDFANALGRKIEEYRLMLEKDQKAGTVVLQSLAQIGLLGQPKSS